KIKLFSIISHDFRTPLADIQQYLEMMVSIDVKESDKKIIEKKLLEVTRHTQELLNNILQWSKNQMEGLKTNLNSINLEEEILPTIEHMKLIASKKEIRLEAYVGSDLYIVADADMLNLILRNILYNAIKFSPMQEVIKFTAKQKN